ncbi:hypothetical protein N665_0135s0040 [Sinapis alba]|nr:hypothetical protein N665_0135s0040 [Sinapis alba]
MDVSKAQSRDYPRRLYPERSSNPEGKDINHNFHIGEFRHVREAIERLYTSLHEFGEITGLNIDPVPTETFEPDQYKAFWEELNIPLGMGPKLYELKSALEVCPSWSFEKRKWLRLLLLQAMGLYALHHNSRIPFESAKRIFDDEAMMSYPWGRTAYEFLVDSIKMLDPQGRSYTINDIKDGLLVWAYEFLSCFGERFGRVVENVDILLLRWGGKCTRASFTTLFSEEMREHGEDSVEEMFPQWSGEAEDPQLVNLITNIHADRFVRGFWEVERNEKKKKVKGGVSSEAEPPTKKQKKIKKQIVSLTSEDKGSGEIVNHTLLVNIMSTQENISRKFDHHEGRFETIESKLNTNNSKQDMPNMDQQIIDDIVKAAVDERLKVLGVGKCHENYDNLSLQPNTQQKFVNSPMIDKTPNKGLGVKRNLAEDFASGVATPATRVKKNLAEDCTLVEDFASGATTPASGGATPGKDDALDFLYISPAKVDKDAKATKAAKAKDAKAQKDGKDEAGQALGRGCRGKPKDQVALLKNEAAAKKRVEALLKRKEAAELKRKAVELKKQKSAVKKESELKKQKVTQIKKEKVDGTGTPPRTNVIRVKFKNKIHARENELLSEFDVEEEGLIRSARIKEYRERSVQLSPKGCALMAVSSAPVFPYIGDNGTTCMRKNFQSSSAIYDPLAPVDPAKFKKHMQHIKEIPPKLPATPTKKPPPRSADYEGDFYNILMKERPWPDTPYGWLFDNQFKINPNLMKFKGTGYEELSKGRIPYDFQTNLKWFEDVDHLYGVLQVSGNHWIDCYDWVIGQGIKESETKMVVAFKSMSQMLPVMLNDIAPVNLRKPSKKQFAFKRRKGKYIPQNTQVGDCGVYSLKFIECLALGVTFDGINDENIQGLRVKMATEIHDEGENSEMNNILS